MTTKMMDRMLEKRSWMDRISTGDARHLWFTSILPSLHDTFMLRGIGAKLCKRLAKP